MSTATAWTRSSQAPDRSAALTFVCQVSGGTSRRSPAFTPTTHVHGWRVRGVRRRDGDGLADVITGAGPGGGPHVRVFSLARRHVTELASFYAYDPAFTGGVHVAAADTTGDGVAEIITGAGPGGGPHVRVFEFSGGALTESRELLRLRRLRSQAGYSSRAATSTGDGLAEVITGAGPGGGPHVRVFSLRGGTLTDIASFYAYDPAFRGGVHVAAADTTGDGVAEIITGAGPSGGPHVRVFGFNGGALTELASFYAYDWHSPAASSLPAATSRRRDCRGDHRRGAGGGPHVRVFDLGGGSPLSIASFFAYDPAFIGGVRVASAATPRGGVAMAAAPGSAGRAVNGHDVNGMVLARITDSLAYGLADTSASGQEIQVPMANRLWHGEFPMDHETPVRRRLELTAVLATASGRRRSRPWKTQDRSIDGRYRDTVSCTAPIVNRHHQSGAHSKARAVMADSRLPGQHPRPPAVKASSIDAISRPAVL